MSGCTSCDQCTRSVIGSLVLLPITLVWMFCFAWNIGLGIRTCPRCGHYLNWHTAKRRKRKLRKQWG